MNEFQTKADLIEAHAQFMFNTYGGSIETERKVSAKEPVFVHKDYAAILKKPAGWHIGSFGFTAQA